MENQEASARKRSVKQLIVEGLCIDGAHHKQWYLEQIAEVIGIDLSDIRDIGYTQGIAP